MDSKRVGLLFSIILLLTCIFYMAATYEILPDRIAVQFDLNNNPTRWQDKSSFVILYLGILLGLNILLLGVLPNFLSKIPDSVINVPWRTYWFSNPQRRLRALARMQTVPAFTGVFVNFVYLFVFHIVYQENTPDPFLHIPADIGVYFILLLSVVFVVGIFLYMKPPKEM
jgi:uncharacterized membrane protein